MAVQLLEALATDFLENQYFLCFDIIGKHSGLYGCALDVRGSHLDVAAIVNEEDLVEFHCLIFLRGKAIYENLSASLYLKLLACNVNDCVHCCKNIKFPTAGVRTRGADLVKALSAI